MSVYLSSQRSSDASCAKYGSGPGPAAVTFRYTGMPMSRTWSQNGWKAASSTVSALPCCSSALVWNHRPCRPRPPMALSSVRSCDGESARHSSIIARPQNRSGNRLTASARYPFSLPYRWPVCSTALSTPT